MAFFIVVDLVECLVELLVLTLDVLVEIREIDCLEIVNHIQVDFGLLLVFEVIILLGHIIFTRN